ncbi:MAG TPA: PHB depolymerase family esterase, partial [Solirubrobacteraceae bacterium]|nr:PHB depolymerase family esterase [Solirubrobacteraceae bacterium]
MSILDWRELYAQNQAAIAASGIRLPSIAPPALPPMGVAGARKTPHRRPPKLLREPGPIVNPHARPSGLRSTPRGSPATEGHALVHVPAGLDREVPVAVVCMLHGCTQDPATFAAATAMNETADRQGFVVVYPGQPRGGNA